MNFRVNVCVFYFSRPSSSSSFFSFSVSFFFFFRANSCRSTQRGNEISFLNKIYFHSGCDGARMPNIAGKWFDVLMVDVSNREKELVKNMFVWSIL